MEDIEIVDLYWARSETAIAETSNKYGRYVRRIAYNILHSNEDSDECVNDTYLGAWNAMPDQRPGRLSVFLGKMTRNIALNKYDYKTAKKRGGGAFEQILSELEDCISAGETVESAFDEGATAEAISVFLRDADADSRNVFLRRYWYADSVGDIAERFGMSESKVKSMLFRTRKRLKEYLEREGIAV